MPTPNVRRLFRLAIALPVAAACPASIAQSIFADSFEPLCGEPPPSVTPGAGSALLLRGTVVTPDTVFEGEVLVQGDTIACAAASCAGQPGATAATIVETGGIILPGLIDTRSTILFDIFDAQDWTPPTLYGSHNEWPNDARYGALVDAKQYLNGEGSALDLGCEMDKYGELKGLLAGTTSIVGSANGPANRACFGSLARTVDQTPNDLGADAIQVNILLPNTAGADATCASLADLSTRAYLVDVAEGTNASALNEFTTLGTVSTNDYCLYAPQTAIVHGTALGDAQLTQMAAIGMSLVWTPSSDLTLYGATANVPLALGKGLNVALGTNWSITGSANVLDELRAANRYDDTQLGDVLSPDALVRMVTTNAAKALALDQTLGSIAAGRKADLTVVAGACAAPKAALLDAGPRQVRLVLVGGVPLYGDAALVAAAPASPGCEALDVCGAPKFVCVAENGGTATNKLGQTLAEITNALGAALSAYDAQNLTQWKFAPLAPLFDCP